MKILARETLDSGMVVEGAAGQRVVVEGAAEQHVTAYLRKWTSTVQSSMAMCPKEAQVLCSELMGLRRRSGRNGSPVNRYVAVWGFGSVHSRNTFLRGLRYALQPRIIYASQKKPAELAPRSNYFEGVLCFQPGVASIEELEALVERFHMSIGIADLDTLMSEAMITCISRVQDGEYAFGNWQSQQNTFYRLEYARRLSQKQEREARMNMQRVTGLPLTTANMLTLYYGRQNLEIDAQLIRNHIGVVLALAEEDADAAAHTLSLATDVEGGTGSQLRAALMTSLDRSYVVQHHLRTLAASSAVSPSPNAVGAVRVAPRAPPGDFPAPRLSPGVLFVVDLTGP